MIPFIIIYGKEAMNTSVTLFYPKKPKTKNNHFFESNLVTSAWKRTWRKAKAKHEKSATKKNSKLLSKAQKSLDDS